MKKLETILFVILLCSTLLAQIPQKMSYQAIIRDADGKLIANQYIGIQISILQGSATGTEVYKEIQNPNPKTNANGLVSIEIGGELAITGTFANINWANGPYFLKTETDPTGGTNYTITGTNQLLSVPYALYAGKAGNSFGGNYNDLNNKPNFTDSIDKYSVLLQGDQTILGHKFFRSDILVQDLTVGRGGGGDESSVALGYYANSVNISGYANTAVGAVTLYNNTTGRYNTADGQGALYSNTIGESNTSIGEYSLFTNTTGSGNTAVGSNANVASGDLINATAIGFGAIVDANNRVRIGNDDVTVIEGKVAFTNLSDRRVKKNIKELHSGLDFILKLNPVEYQMKQGDDKINYGFIAQDIEALVGTSNSILTIGMDKDRTLGLRYTDFIAPLVKALQEQQAIINGDHAKISSLEEANLQLESRLKAIEEKLNLK